MKALILAAGLGSRLGKLTENCPKTMVPVNGKPILEKQIENLLENNISDITIVTGYKSEVIEDFISNNYPFIKIIKSIYYNTTNNMYSAYLAKESFYNQEFLMMNGDVYYDSSVLTELLKDYYYNSIVTDIGLYNEESMKVVKSNGKLISISKQISENEALGCSIDVYKFSKEGSKKFFEKCTEYIESQNQLKLWSEVALNDILEDVEFTACPLVGRWFEIDNFSDLEKASELFKEKIENTKVKTLRLGS